MGTTMSEGLQNRGPARVADDEVWRYTKLIFTTSALVFLVTIALGFLNVFTTGALPRWQLLVHLHSGSLGWMTVSFFGATVWLFTGDRSVNNAYPSRVRWLAGLLIVAFVGLIGSFGIAHSQGGATFSLLAVFGPFAALMIWMTALFFLGQLRRLSVVTTAHLSAAAGFFVLGIAATFATVVALGRAGLLATPDFALTGHIFSTTGFSVLLTAAIIEWLIVRDRGHWTRAGVLQVGLGVLLGIWVPLLLIGSVAGVPGGVLSVLLLVGFNALFLLFGLVFLGRVAPKALRTNPLSAGFEAWVFFATLWFFIGLLSFPVRAALGDPDWWLTVNTHVVFIGIVTNLLFGVLSARTLSARVGYTWAQPTAMWLMNGGLVIFAALFIASGSRHGALVMGSGVLLGIVWMLLSLRETPAQAVPTAQEVDETTD
jgi:hypothetical protein